MKFYLSSYKIGNETVRLKEMIPDNRRTAYIPNALDFSADVQRRSESNDKDMNELKSVGLEPELFDLRRYFGKEDELASALKDFGVVWVRGGNAFVLMQAMKMSGFDTFLKTSNDREMLYGAYSAGVCVLAPTLHGIELMDDPLQKPYGNNVGTAWEGLGILDYYVVPHYCSAHQESELAEKAVQYYIDNKLLFKALRDGEVITIG